MHPYLRFIVEYNGRDYIGWQRNPQGLSVQEAMETALSVYLGCDSVNIIGAGRTDSGVHALYQVAGCRVPDVYANDFDPHNPKHLRSLYRGMNGLLPRSIAVRQVALMPEGFDPRRQADIKTYRYHVLNAPMDSPMLRHMSWHVIKPLDTDAMQRAADQCVGEHDFTSFKGRLSNAKTSVRTITDFRVERSGAVITITVQGTGFLKHMVRNLAGTLVDIGKGKIPAEAMAGILAQKDRNAAGQNAPPKGLVLMHITFSEPWDTAIIAAPEEVASHGNLDFA